MLSEGAFVRALFPTSERPRVPGLVHICYCLAVRPPLALMAYTTTAAWAAGVPLPFGVRSFSHDEAMVLNQRRAFRLHLNRQARMVMSAAWFPDLHAAHQGVIAMAPPRLRDELFALTVELEKRHRLGVDRLGL